MRINPFKFKTLVFVILSGFLFTSCGSDDDNKPNPTSISKSNSYSITVEDQVYARSWEAGESHDGTSLWSTYVLTDEGSEIMSLGITDEETIFILDASFSMDNNQAFPLGDLSDDGWDENSGFSYILIHVGDIDYESFTGSATVSKLKREPFLGLFGGFATYDLAIEGVFRKFDPSLPYLEPEDREEVTITGTVHVGSQL